MIIYIGDWANMPPTFLLFIAALFWCCEGSKWKKITLALTFSSAPFSLNCLIDSFLDMPHLGHLSIIYQIGKIAFWFLLWYVVKRFKFPNNFDLPVKYWYVLSLIACTPLLILFSIVLLPEDSEYIYPSMTRTIICILFIVILSILGILYAIYALYKASILEENKLLSEANDQYYKHLDSQIQQIRKLRHDMTNHLQVLSNLPEEEVKDYVQQLLVDKAIRNPIVYTRDSVLNAILSSKADFMEQNQIDFDYEISLEQDIPLSPTDKCALFGNLLDNAIEGCLKISQNRKIMLKITSSKGLFIIKIKNTCLEEVSNSLQTSKSDKENHGFGMKSIKEVVARHHGTIEISTNSGWFEVFIVVTVFLT